MLFDGNRTLKLTARDGLFLSSSPAMDPITGSSKAELHAHLSSITGVDVRKYPTNRPVTAEQLHLRTDHVFTDRLRYLQRHELVKGIKGVKLSLSSDCDACRLGKSFRKHVPATSLRPPAPDTFVEWV